MQVASHAGNRAAEFLRSLMRCGGLGQAGCQRDPCFTHSGIQVALTTAVPHLIETTSRENGAGLASSRTKEIPGSKAYLDYC